MPNFSSVYCPFCGKVRPLGFGPCNCSGWNAYEKKQAGLIQLSLAKAAAEKEENEITIAAKARSCNHEWAGGSPASTRCRICGISYGQYCQHT